MKYKKGLIKYSYDKIKKDKYMNKKRKFTKQKKIRKRKFRSRCDSSSDSSDSDSDSDDDYSNFFFNHGEIYTENNHIWYNTSVTKKSTNRLVRIIHNKNNEYNDSVNKMRDVANLTPKPLYLHINSYGGDLLAVMAVVDAIKNSKIPIHTIIEGVAASAGTIMSVVGHKRYITSNSYMLIHQLSTGMRGTMEDLKEEMINNRVFMKRIKDIYAEHTKISRSELTNALKHDLWWDAKTCLKKGLVDEIYQPNI